jgi:hypothetical protein
MLKSSNNPSTHLFVFSAAYMKLEAGWKGVYFDPELENSQWNGAK